MKKRIKWMAGFCLMLVLLSPASSVFAEENIIDKIVSVFDVADVTVNYQTHVQDDGLQDYVSNGQISGTVGRSLRLEGIRMNVQDNDNLGIKYQTHVENVGWQDWKYDNDFSGTEGESLRLEAIKIELTGSDADKYNVYYRVHVQNLGWMGWAKNGEISGSEGYGYRLEGIEIMVLSKNDDAPVNTVSNVSYYENIINYTTNVESLGWMQLAKMGDLSGTEDNLYMQGVNIFMADSVTNLDVRYRSHDESGWGYWQSGGEDAGVNTNMTALQLELTGKDADKYNIYYRVCMKGQGWQSFVKNGETAGDENGLNGISAIQINVFPVGQIPISFESNFGSESPDLISLSNDDIKNSTLPVITRPGYTFTGWFDNAEFVGDALTQLPSEYSSSGLIFYAKWTANSSTIVFEENGGSEVSDLNGVTDQVITDRTLPVITKENSTFDGWFDNAEFTGAAVAQLPETYPIDSVKYYAKWIESETTTISYVTNIDGFSIGNRLGLKGETITDRAMPEITKDGYKLSWYDNEEFEGDIVTELPEVFPDEDVTYYAKWTLLTEVNIHFVSNSLESTIFDMTGEPGKEITDQEMPNVEKAGYTFLGWFDNEAFEGDVVTKLPAVFPDEDLSYYAKWSADTATIKFISNLEGTTLNDMVGVTDQVITNRTMPAITREDYRLSWYDNAEFTGNAITQLPEKYPAGTTTYYARWIEINEVVLSFEENGGSLVTDLTGLSGETILTRTMPVVLKNGYTFIGWFDNKDLTGSSISMLPDVYPSENMTYFAKWSVNPSTIIFEENGGSLATDLTGVTDQLINDRTMPAITKDGYTLSWYTNSAFTGNAVTQLPEKYPAGTTTYYARWIESETVTISFDENGGSETGDLTGIPDQTITDRTMPNVTLDNCIFDGWFDNEAFEGDAVTQLPEKFSDENLTYYAKWIPETVTISFEENGGSLAVDVLGRPRENIADRTMLELTREDYIFRGWYDNEAFEGDAVTELPEIFPDENLTYYAKWIPETVTISFEENGGMLAADVSGRPYEAIASVLPVITRDEFIFAGWFDNAEFEGDAIAVMPETFPESDTIYYAKWIAEMVTISFEENGGMLAADVSGTPYEEITSELPVITRDEYIFAGWYDNEAFEGDAIAAMPETFPESDTIYYAKWIPETVTINFVENGGTLAADISGRPGNPIASVLPVISREGYVFAGWFDNAGFAGNAITQLPETFPEGNMTYFAKWN